MARLTVTRVTHSCVLLDFDGHVLLTDPWFSEKRGYLRGEPLAVSPAALPRLAAVLSSHGHYDHYDVRAFAAYPDRSVPFLVRRGTAAAARAAGFTDVRELDHWQTAEAGPFRVTATPARHGVPENTYVVEHGDRVVFFGADTLRIPELDGIARRFPRIDVALLPINGLQIRPAFNRRVVMNAEEAADLAAVLKPDVAIPIHYAFTGGPVRDRLLLRYDGTPARFLTAMASRAPGVVARVLAPGEPFEVPARRSPAAV